MGNFANYLTGKEKSTDYQKFSWLRAIAFVVFVVAVIICGRIVVVGLPDKQENVWLDTSDLPDENVALATTLANRRTVNLCGVTVQPLGLDRNVAIKNTLSLLSFFGAKDIPVADGAHGALVQEQAAADTRYALDDLGLKDNGKNYTEANNILSMRNAILSLPKDEKITIIALTPLTTTAVLLKNYPEVAPKISRIIFMGGAINVPGTQTKDAEFNIYQDPEAFEVVKDSGVPLVMIPLDLTQSLKLSREDFEPLLNSDKEELVQIGRFIDQISKSREEFKGQVAPVHDMVCVQYLTNPENFKGYYADVEVIKTGEQRGKITVTPKEDGSKGGVYILSECSEENFVKTFKQHLDALTEYIYYFKVQK